MTPVYFRQDVLIKYEAASGFDVKDDGSVSCRHYWGLVRSTSRIGNELLATAIGDFAEGVPFDEWPHWRQYAVEPPSADTVAALRQETVIPKAVNDLLYALNHMNDTFSRLAIALGVTLPEPLWRGSLDSLAGHQLKWVYPATANDDEFLKRATLTSTLFLDGLLPTSMRTLLGALDKSLHQTFDKAAQPLGSRNLLQRMALMARVIDRVQPALTDIPLLLRQAEGKAANASQDMQAELDALYKGIRDDFAPLAFLYDLRTHGGLAHPPNAAEVAIAAGKLGLPGGNWHRTDYLRLLKCVTDKFTIISDYFNAATLRLSR